MILRLLSAETPGQFEQVIDCARVPMPLRMAEVGRHDDVSSPNESMTGLIPGSSGSAEKCSIGAENSRPGTSADRARPCPGCRLDTHRQTIHPERHPSGSALQMHHAQRGMSLEHAAP